MQIIRMKLFLIQNILLVLLLLAENFVVHLKDYGVLYKKKQK